MSATGPDVPDAPIRAGTLCSGKGSGELLVLDEPLSFWGGTDLHTGAIVDAHHPQCGRHVAGKVLVMDASRGSSSSSSVLAEQVRAGVGPAAIVLSARDAIVCLGALAAAELYGTFLPVVLVDAAGLARLRALSGPATATVAADETGAVITTDAPATVPPAPATGPATGPAAVPVGRTAARTAGQAGLSAAPEGAA